MAEEVEWFVGIDWASQTHQVCLIDAKTDAVNPGGSSMDGVGRCSIR
jgi:hypothetical protein